MNQPAPKRQLWHPISTLSGQSIGSLSSFGVSVSLAQTVARRTVPALANAAQSRATSAVGAIRRALGG